jgi:hypothetical protein
LPILPNVMGGKLRLAGFVVGCCLWAAASGCLCHRTPDGFAFGNQVSVEYSHFPWLKFRSAQDANSPNPNTGSVAANPELLPWRSRLKGHRLGARAAHERETTGDQYAYETAATPAAKTPPSEPSIVPTSALSDDAQPASPTPSTKADVLQLPVSVGRLPESNRPDLVID